MARIERFEDVEAWQQARNLVQKIYQATSQGAFRRDLALRDQLQRAAVSIMANIAEGFDSRSTKEFLKFLAYAFRSTTEVQSHLYVALDQGYLDQPSFQSLYDRSVKVKSIISGFMRYLRAARNPDSVNGKRRTSNVERRTEGP